MKSPNPDCADVRQNLYLLVGGELDSRQLEQATEQHLAECASCRGELASAEQARALYLTAAVDADSEELDLWPGIRSRLYSEQLLAPRRAPVETAPAQLAPVFSLRRLAPITAVFAAAAALLLALPFLREQFAPAPTVATPPIVAQPADHSAPTLDTPAVIQPEYVANQGGGLRPVLIGDESLIEREQRLLQEQLLNPNSGAGATDTHPFQSSMYDVVNQRRLR